LAASASPAWAITAAMKGFETFSKMRPLFYQARFSALKFLAPPYGKFANRTLTFLTR